MELKESDVYWENALVGSQVTRAQLERTVKCVHRHMTEMHTPVSIEEARDIVFTAWNASSNWLDLLYRNGYISIADARMR
jgi:hypothetical protein